jgi:hypothetical protein
MSKEKFEHALKNLYEKMIADNIKGIMQYRPFFDEYWEQNPKVVICNYENFGYQDIEKPSVLTYKDFEWWLDERMNKSKKSGKSKTVHYTSVFANALLKMLNEFPATDFSYQEIRKSFWKYDELYKIMKNVMYMNLRPSSASRNKQEIGTTHQIIRKYKHEMKAYLESLDADIFIISTKDAIGLFNYIFDITEKPLLFKKGGLVNNMMVFSVKHFGRPNYRYWYKTALEIAYIWYHR